MAKIFRNYIPDCPVNPIPDGDNITDNDNEIDSNHPTPTPPITDENKTLVTSPSSEIVITHDFPRVSIQPTNNHSRPRVDENETLVTSPSPEIVITHDFSRVGNQSTNNHSLTRAVARPTYAERTVNSNIRRRKAKKKMTCS